MESSLNVAISFFFLHDFKLGILLGNGQPARLGPSQSCQGITVLPCSPQGVRSGPQLPWSGVFDLAPALLGTDQKLNNAPLATPNPAPKRVHLCITYSNCVSIKGWQVHTNYPDNNKTIYASYYVLNTCGHPHTHPRFSV